MFNSEQTVSRRANLGLAAALVYGYVGLTFATLVAMVIMTITAPQLATNAAWGHQVIVAVFAVVLPLRIRAARRGNQRAVRAVAIIAVVVGVVNLVEALLPAFPAWMRIVMIVVVLIMAALAGIVTGRMGAQRARTESDPV